MFGNVAQDVGGFYKETAHFSDIRLWCFLDQRFVELAKIVMNLKVRLQSICEWA